MIVKNDSEDVLEWVKSTFPTYRPMMKRIEWGFQYNEYHNATPANADALVNKIMESEDEITNIEEVYHAVLSGDMKYLNARNFSDTDKKWAYKKQGGKCSYCHGEFDISEMAGDYIRLWSKGGKTDRDNIQTLCASCNSKKSAHDVVYKPWDTSVYEDFDLGKLGSINGE